MKIKNNYTAYILLLFVLYSCIDNLDFDQVNKYETRPQYLASLISFKIPAVSFTNGFGAELTTPIVDESSLSVIQERLLQDNLIQLDLEFEISNPFDRDILLIIEFLNDTDITTYLIEPILIPANELNIIRKEVIVIANSPQFLNSTKIRTTLQINTTSGSPIDPTDVNEFEFKSAGILTFKI